MGICPICNKNAEESVPEFMSLFKCDRCGYFGIDKSYSPLFQSTYIEIPNHLLSGFIREYSDRNGDYYYFKFDKNEVEYIINQLPRDNDVLGKARKLLLAIERRTKHPGQKIELIWEQDYPLAYSQNTRELLYYLEYLKGIGQIDGTGTIRGTWETSITVDGWHH